MMYDNGQSQRIPPYNRYPVEVAVLAHQVEATALLHRRQVQRIAGTEVVEPHSLIHHFQVWRCEGYQCQVGEGPQTSWVGIGLRIGL